MVDARSYHLGTPERRLARPDGGPAPQGRLVRLLGHRRGELQVAARAGKAGLLEQKRLPLDEIAQRLSVVLDLAHPLSKLPPPTVTRTQSAGAKARAATTSRVL